MKFDLEWTTDVTEFKCTQGKLYLSSIKDLFNDKIIAYDLATSPNFEQMTRMMKRAVARLDGAKPILHSDQGWQYQMADFKETSETKRTEPCGIQNSVLELE